MYRRFFNALMFVGMFIPTLFLVLLALVFFVGEAFLALANFRLAFPPQYFDWSPVVAGYLFLALALVSFRSAKRTAESTGLLLN